LRKFYLSDDEVMKILCVKIDKIAIATILHNANNDCEFCIWSVSCTELYMRFLKLEGDTVTIDLTEYPLPPIEPVFNYLIAMVSSCW